MAKVSRSHQALYHERRVWERVGPFFFFGVGGSSTELDLLDSSMSEKLAFFLSFGIPLLPSPFPPPPPRFLVLK